MGSDFQKVQYGLMLGSDDAELRERLNLALLELIESGVYGRLHDAVVRSPALTPQRVGLC